MRAVIQRVNQSSVTIDDKIVGKIDKGYCILVGFANDDTEEKLDKLVDKIIKLRIFDDEDHNMNKSIKDVDGSILLISNFTLYANCEKGNRPAFTDALKYGDAKKLYIKLIEKFKSVINTQNGEFGADMKINIENDGPVTIILDV